MKKILFALALAGTVLSCVPLDTPPYDRETDLNYWEEDPDAALSALNTCYTTLTDMYELVYSDGMTDNAYVKGGQNKAIGNGTYGTSEGYVYDVWNRHYSGIRACNELLVNIDRVTSLDAGLKARYIAEARVLRAFHYYELYTRFGGVPYLTAPISIEESRTVARDSRETVVSNIISELKEVTSGDALPASYSGADRGRVTRWAAKALLARVYLFEGNYAEVKTVTDDIIANSGAALYPSGHTAFGWATVLAFAEMWPELQDTLLRRGFEFGENRIITGAHYQSDVNAGYLCAAAGIARAHSNPAFEEDIKAARAEYRRLKGLPANYDPTEKVGLPLGKKFLNAPVDTTSYRYPGEVLRYQRAKAFRLTARGDSAIQN